MGTLASYLTNGRVGLMAVLPRQLVAGGCVFVGLLLLHDEAHVLIGLVAGLQEKPVSAPTEGKLPPSSAGVEAVCEPH